METSLIFHSGNPDETAAFGKKLGSFLKKGDVVALSGELGAGKTTLVAAIAKGLGIPDHVAVCSPSYTLVNEYDGRVPLSHFDLYRLEGADDIYDLGFEEYMEGDSVCVLEWADMAPDLLPEEYLEIRISIKGEESRELDVRAFGKRYAVIVERVRTAYKETAP